MVAPVGKGATGVRALALAAVALALVPAGAAAREPLRFGLNDAILTHPEDPDVVLDAHLAIGATVLRTAVHWRDVQPEPGTWHWAATDEAIGRAARRGLKTIAVLYSVPPWAAAGAPSPHCSRDRMASRCQPPPAPERLADFQEFVAQLAIRYPSLAAIEVFNEPNVAAWTWQPRADPEHYARVLRAAHEAVERVRPRLPVLSGGIAFPGVPTPPGSMSPGEFLERMYRAGARGAMDGIAVHPYPADTSPFEAATSSYHRLMAETTAIRNRRRDRDVPLWITEVGYTTTGPFAVTPGRQSRWLVRILEDAFAREDVAAVVVHTLRDPAGSPASPESGYGLLNGDFSPKPAFHAVGQAVGREHARRANERRRARLRRTFTRRCERVARRRSLRGAKRRAYVRRCVKRAERRHRARRKGQAVTRERE